jgi:hypothetical protein
MWAAIMTEGVDDASHGFVFTRRTWGILKDGHGYWDTSLGRLGAAPGYDDLSRTLVINLRSYV